MRPGQTLVVEGIQAALFPMEYLNITQPRNGRPTHMGINADDLAGKDRGKDKWYAPFDIEVIWLELDRNKTGVVVTNTGRVLLANGQIAEPKTIGIMLWHDDWIGGLVIGARFKQGEYFYEEGTAGMATGNHVHEELSRYTRINHAYPFDVTPTGYLTIQGTGLNIEDAFFLNGTTIVNSGGYKFKTYGSGEVTIPKSLLDQYEVGDYIEYSTEYYSHHENQIIKQGRIKGYVIHKYPLDHNQLAVSDTKGGKQIGATRVENVFNILKKNTPVKPVDPLAQYNEGDKILISTVFKSHHELDIIAQGEIEAYIIKKYPKDNNPLAISLTKGGPQYGGTRPENVFSILKKG